MLERIYQGVSGTKIIELWVRKYPSDMPYVIKVNDRITVEADDMHSAYGEYNNAFKED